MYLFQNDGISVQDKHTLNLPVALIVIVVDVSMKDKESDQLNNIIILFITKIITIITFILIYNLLRIRTQEITLWI